MKKKNIKVSKTLYLTGTDVALVWGRDGDVDVYVSDEDLTQNMPDHVLQAMAVMMSMDDPEITGLMWDKLEKKMDRDFMLQRPKNAQTTE